MGTPRADHTATLLNDGTVLVAGAFSFIAPGSLSGAELFDPTTNQFTPTGPMEAGRFLHTATRLNNGLVLVTGGQSTIAIPEVFASSAELYK
jgi:Galactose oxidase, central domain